MATVNPPPVLRRPPEFERNRNTRAYLKSLEDIIFQLWLKVDGSSSDFANIEQDILSNNALINALQQQVGSGDILTIDTTGFTVDTTKQFTDEVQA